LTGFPAERSLAGIEARMATRFRQGGCLQMPNKRASLMNLSVVFASTSRIIFACYGVSFFAPGQTFLNALCFSAASLVG
jgi:hypothetical protein